MSSLSDRDAWIREQYASSDKTVEQIAHELGVTYLSLAHYANKNGIRKKRRGCHVWNDYMQGEMERLSRLGVNDTAIARYLGCKTRTVTTHRANSGLPGGTRVRHNAYSTLMKHGFSSDMIASMYGVSRKAVISGVKRFRSKNGDA